MNLQKAIAEQKRHFIFNGKCFIKRIAAMKYIIGNTKGFKIAGYSKANRFYKLNFNEND